LGLHQTEATLKLFPFDFSAELMVTVGAKLETSLTVHNTGKNSFTFSEALHTYFNISDIADISIDGLGGTEYEEGTRIDARKRQSESKLVIRKGENRRSIDTLKECVITDTVFDRKIHAAKQGSSVTVVWNPGAEAEKTMKDIREGGYRIFVCVEAVNACEDVVTLSPFFSK
jgi:D-hexose-6-phosphate mutarotase